MEKSRKALQLARERQKRIKTERQARLYRRLYEAKSDKCVSNIESNEDIDSKNIEYDEIINSILRNIGVHLNARRYDDKIYQLASNINSISPQALRYIRAFIPLPSYESIHNHLTNLINERFNSLLDINQIDDIVNDYKDNQLNIFRSAPIDCILSVDAIAFSPDVTITKDNKIIGLKKDVFQNIENPYQFFCENAQQWLNSLMINWNQIENYAFVYYIQPINPDYSCSIIHFSPSPQGKATNIQCETLETLRNKLKNHKMYVLGFAFDGDNCYDFYHDSFFSQYEGVAEHYTASIVEIAKRVFFRYISDPLHMLKRARYRLLKGVPLAIGFNRNSPIIDIYKIREELNLLPILINDSKITKMHDILPISLFSINNTLMLYEKHNFSAILYFLPWSLFIEAMSNNNVNLSERISLFEITFFLMFIYYKFLKKTKLDTGLKQRKMKNIVALTLFDEKLCIHCCNTIHSFVTLLLKDMNSKKKLK